MADEAVETVEPANIGGDMGAVLSGLVRRRMQHDYLMGALFRDQHGRRWGCQVSTVPDARMHPATPMAPYGWRAPAAVLVAPAKYHVFPEGEFGTFTIDYDAWIQDTAVEWTRYEQHVNETARRLFPNGAGQAVAERNPVLLREAGNPPMHVDFVRAMKAGNPWVLGMLKPDGSAYGVPAKLVPWLGTLERIETYEGSASRSLLDVDADEFRSPDEAAPMEPVVALDEEWGEVATVAPRRGRRSNQEG